MARKKGEGHYSTQGPYHVWTLGLGKDPKTGKEKNKVIKRRDLKEVKKLVRAYLRGVEDGAPASGSGMTVGKWADLWLATVKNHREESTWESYEGTWRNWLKKRCCNVPLDKLATVHVQLAVDDAREAGQDRTAIYVLEIAKRMVNAAKRQNPPLMAPNHNPCAGVIVPEAAPARDRILSHDEADEILTEMYRTDSLFGKGVIRRGYGHRHLVRFLLETGLRESEACGLQNLQVNLKEKTCRVAAQLAREGGKWIIKPYTKGRNVRVVPLSDAAVEAIKEHRKLVAAYREKAGEAFDDWGLVFASEEGTPISPRNLLRTIERLTRNVNADRKEREEQPMEPWTIHDLRRTFGTRIAQTGANMKVAQKLLGHRKIETTAKIYVIAEADDTRAAVDAMKNRSKAG